MFPLSSLARDKIFFRRADNPLLLFPKDWWFWCWEETSFTQVLRHSHEGTTQNSPTHKKFLEYYQAQLKCQVASELQRDIDHREKISNSNFRPILPEGRWTPETVTPATPSFCIMQIWESLGILAGSFLCTTQKRCSLGFFSLVESICQFFWFLWKKKVQVWNTAHVRIYAQTDN